MADEAKTKKHKYPFIADKTMYAALMGALSMVKSTKAEPERAAAFYAQKYKVDEKELRKHLLDRIDAEQGFHDNMKNGKRYYWFIVQRIREESSPFRQRVIGDFRLIRALTARNAQFQGCLPSDDKDTSNDNAVYFEFNEVLSDPISDRDHAIQYLETHKRQLFEELKRRKPHLYE